MSPSSTRSCLYFGQVMHRRLRPFRHRFAYRVFSLLVDLDELPALDRRLRFFSYNRINLFGFHDRDHGPCDGAALRPWIEAELTKAGIALDGGAVRLLCFPRILGYVFNPLTVWFCHGPEGDLRAVLYEVRNTFGERHAYLLPVATDRARSGPVRQRCAKRFYVSPFIEMAGHYRFRLYAPAERLSLLIRESAAEGELLSAALTGRRAPLSDRQLLRALLAYPLLTFKVVAAIHWEALRLWLKGARPHPRPKPPAEPVTSSAAPVRHPGL